MRKPLCVLLVGVLIVQMCGTEWIWAQSQRGQVVAVMDFQNTSGRADLDHLGPSIAESLLTHLARRGRLTLVERSRLASVMEELRLGLTDFVDPETAAEVGKSLGANVIILGSYTVVANLLQINARGVGVSTGQILFAEQVKGRQGESLALVDALGAALWSKLVGVQLPKRKRWVQRWWVWGLVLSAAGGAAAAVLLGGKKAEGPDILPYFPSPPPD